MLTEQKIKMVEVTDEETYMCDLEVTDNHNFFLNSGYLTHNSINLLKAATETDDQRLITKSNYSKAQEDLPDRFIFKGRLIFDYNSLAGINLRDDFEALVSRGTPIDFVLSQEETGKIMQEIANEDWEIEVTNYLLENYQYDGYAMLNLRTQWKAFQTYKFAQSQGTDWKKELGEELRQNMSKTRSMLYSLIGTKVFRSLELKKLLLDHGFVSSLRTAHRRVEDWLELGELHKCSDDERNFYVSINPPKDIMSRPDLVL